MRYIYYCFFFFFKQKTAYEMRISDWSSDVCSSDLAGASRAGACHSRGRLRPDRSERHRQPLDHLAGRRRSPVRARPTWTRVHGVRSGEETTLSCWQTERQELDPSASRTRP